MQAKGQGWPPSSSYVLYAWQHTYREDRQKYDAALLEDNHNPNPWPWQL